MATKRTLGDRPNNEEWGPGRNHGGASPSDGPPKGDAPPEDLHRRGDAPAGDDEPTQELPVKGAISIPAHLRAAFDGLVLFLSNLIAKGTSGDSVLSRLSAAWPGGLLGALMRGRTQPEIEATFTSENEAFSFAVGEHDGGAAFRVWSLLGVPFVHPVTPPEAPNANPIDPLTKTHYAPTRDPKEAIRRLDLGNVGAPGWAPVGWAGNGLVPDRVAREFYAIERRFNPEYAGPSSPIDPAWVKVKQDVALVVCAGGIASLFSPDYADIYAPMEDAREALLMQPALGPSGDR